jgi:hypothetical protein
MPGIVMANPSYAEVFDIVCNTCALVSIPAFTGFAVIFVITDSHVSMDGEMLSQSA